MRSSVTSSVQRAMLWLLMICGLTVTFAHDVDFTGSTTGGEGDTWTGKALAYVATATQANGTLYRKESGKVCDVLGHDGAEGPRRSGDDDRGETKEEAGHSCDELWAHGLWWSAAAVATAAIAVDEGRQSSKGVVQVHGANTKVTGGRASRARAAEAEVRRSRAPWTAPHQVGVGWRSHRWRSTQEEA